VHGTRLRCGKLQLAANVLSQKARRLNKNNLIYLLTFEIYAAWF
jgi:hypothetical protein